MKYAHQCALFFYDLGFNVFPCYDGRDPIWKTWKSLQLKNPMWYFSKSSPSREDLMRFFERTELFGLEMGEYTGPMRSWRGKYLVGIDCDNKHDKHGVELLQKTFGIDDRTTFSVQTATGNGRHYYFLSDVPVRNRANMLPGIDVRGYHGFLYMPGSTFLKNDTQCKYTALSRDIRAITTIPDNLLETVLTKEENKETEETLPSQRGKKTYIEANNLFTLCREHIPAQAEKHPDLYAMTQDLEGEMWFAGEREMIVNNLCLLADTPEGSRNNALYTIGSFLFAQAPRYLSYEKAFSLLFAASPLPDAEKMATIGSASASRRQADKFFDRDDPLFAERYAQRKHRNVVVEDQPENGPTM